MPSLGPRDYIAEVQILPRGAGAAARAEIGVPTTSGAIYLFDGETGAQRWNTPVGIRYSPIVPVAANSHSIIVTRRDYFYMLDRDTGIQRVYRKDLGERLFGVKLDATPQTAPAASEDIAVFTFSDRVIAYALPDFDRITQARDRTRSRSSRKGLSPAAAVLDTTADAQASGPAVITPNWVACPGANGDSCRSTGHREGADQIQYRTLAAWPRASPAAASPVSALDSMSTPSTSTASSSTGGSQQGDRSHQTRGQRRRRLRHQRESGLFSSSLPDRAGWSRRPRSSRRPLQQDARERFKVDKAERAREMCTADSNGKMLILDGDRGGVWPSTTPATSSVSNGGPTASAPRGDGQCCACVRRRRPDEPFDGRQAGPGRTRPGKKKRRKKEGKRRRR